MTVEYGIGMFFFGMTITFIGLFIVFLVINHNQREEARKKIKENNPMYDLMKDMPGVKYGDDCQWRTYHIYLVLLKQIITKET